MNTSRFTKMDEGFICKFCGARVLPLGYSSRDHCPHCLFSLHVDVNPGDRVNECRGLLKPIEITNNGKKGYVINYKCEKCKQLHNNKVASDDDFETILSLSNKTFEERLNKILKKGDFK